MRLCSVRCLQRTLHTELLCTLCFATLFCSSTFRYYRFMVKDDEIAVSTHGANLIGPVFYYHPVFLHAIYFIISHKREPHTPAIADSKSLIFFSTILWWFHVFKRKSVIFIFFFGTLIKIPKNNSKISKGCWFRDIIFSFIISLFF